MDTRITVSKRGKPARQTKHLTIGCLIFPRMNQIDFTGPFEVLMLTRYFEVEERQLKGKAAKDPQTAVAVDIALLRSIRALPAEWLISGLVYDVATGLIQVVVPPTRIRAA